MLIALVYALVIISTQNIFIGIYEMKIVSLNYIHYFGILTIFVMFIVFYYLYNTNIQSHPLYKKIYVWMINFTQPYESTITTSRMEYKHI